MLANTLFQCINITSKDSASLNVFASSAINFVTYQNCNHMRNNVTYQCIGNINNTFVIIFLIGSPAISSLSPLVDFFYCASLKLLVMFLQDFLLLVQCFSILQRNQAPEMVPSKDHQKVFVMLVLVVLSSLEFFRFRTFFLCHRHSTLTSQAYEDLCYL